MAGELIEISRRLIALNFHLVIILMVTLTLLVDLSLSEQITDENPLPSDLVTGLNANGEIRSVTARNAQEQISDLFTNASSLAANVVPRVSKRPLYRSYCKGRACITGRPAGRRRSKAPWRCEKGSDNV